MGVKFLEDIFDQALVNNIIDQLPELTFVVFRLLQVIDKKQDFGFVDKVVVEEDRHGFIWY